MVRGRHAKILQGVVVSDKMNKTRVVEVSRLVKHGIFHKYVWRKRRYKVHDERNESKAGNLVEMVESRPLSKDKRWRLKRVVEGGSPSQTKA